MVQAHRSIQKLRLLARDFSKCQKGSLYVLMALATIPMVAFMGLAIDTGRSYYVKSQLSQAVDAAALAGGRYMIEEDQLGDIQKFFAANYPEGFMDTELDPLEINIDLAADTVEVSATARVPTTFLRVLNIYDVTVDARALVVRQVRGIELALVLDVTGSMNSTDDEGAVKLTSLKQAGNELLDILYSGNETLENVWISVIPVSGRVNFSANSGWMDPLPGPWNGCGQVRAEPAGSDDTPPSVEPFEEYAFGDGNSTDYSGYDWYDPNLGCPATAALPLTAEKSTIASALNGLTALGQTRMDVGMVWGWRVLSPSWRGVWPTADPELPLDYDTDQMDKAIVIMTDGQNQPWDGSSLSEVNIRLAEACAAVKAAGIRIYTVVFDVSAGSPIDILFRGCATQPDDHYVSPTGAELEVAFAQIGSKLSNLRLAE